MHSFSVVLKRIQLNGKQQQTILKLSAQCPGQLNGSKAGGDLTAFVV